MVHVGEHEFPFNFPIHQFHFQTVSELLFAFLGTWN